MIEAIFLVSVLAQDVTAATSATAVTEIVSAAPITAPVPLQVESVPEEETAESESAGDLDLLELTVTATRIADDPWVLPPMVTVIGQQRLRQLPLDQTPNLLRSQPGILVQRSNLGGGSPFIHGMTGKQVLLLVDGVRLNNSLYRFGPHQYLNTIDPYTVQRIEVVRGPASVLYGSDALGGVLNIITKDPALDDVSPGVSVGASSAESALRGRFQLDGSVQDLGMLAGVSGHRFQNLRAGGNIGIQPNTGYDSVAADLKLTRELSDTVSLVGATQVVRQYNVPKSNETLLGGKLKYDYEPQFRWLTYAQVQAYDMDGLIDDAVLSVSTQSHEEGEEIISKAGAPERRERNDARTYGTFLHLSKEVGLGNTVSVGGEWYTDRIQSEALEADTTGTRTARPTFPDGARYESYGLYVQDEFRPIDSVGFLLGGRYSRFRAGGTLPGVADLHLDVDDMTGSAGAVWEFVPGVFAAAQASQGFRAPNMEDFFGKVDFLTEIPNTALRPEKSNDYEAGLKLRRWGFRGETFYYRSYYRDLIDRVNVNADVDGDGVNEMVVQRRNIGRARIHGVESGLTYTFLPIEVFATYAWTFGDKLAKKNGEWEPVEPLRRIPPRQGAGGTRFVLDDETFLGAEVEWAKRQDRLAPGDETDPRIGPEGTPGYVVLHFRSGVGLGEGGSLRMGVENVLDKQYKTHGSGIWFAGRSYYVDYAIGL